VAGVEVTRSSDRLFHLRIVAVAVAVAVREPVALAEPVQELEWVLAAAGPGAGGGSDATTSKIGTSGNQMSPKVGTTKKPR
jgi:hypothetical protein